MITRRFEIGVVATPWGASSTSLDFLPPASTMSRKAGMYAAAMLLIFIGAAAVLVMTYVGGRKENGGQPERVQGQGRIDGEGGEEGVVDGRVSGSRSSARGKRGGARRRGGGGGGGGVGVKQEESWDSRDGAGATISKDIGVPLMRGDDALYPILVNRGDITVKNITIESQKVKIP